LGQREHKKYVASLFARRKTFSGRGHPLLVQRSTRHVFQAQVEVELAAINVALDLIALRESRGLSQARLAERLGITQSAIAQLEPAQPKNVELRTLVRVAIALGAQMDVSIRPRRQTERKTRKRTGSKAKKLATSRSPA
jgi:DNA-binding Xre family transcriptional regulator